MRFLCCNKAIVKRMVAVKTLNGFPNKAESKVGRLKEMCL